jgi:glycine/D-amino acid oxidase-like deaminating enzyme
MPYGMASNFNSGVKVGLHGGKQVRLPSEIDYETDSHLLSQVKRFTDRHMPDVLGLRYARVCLYTMTPDEHFIIDRHPQYPQIVFGAGCSGHAFKFTPLLGKILADLAVQGSTEYDIQLFAANRFLSA